MAEVTLARTSVDIDVPAEEVWSVLGRRFGDIGDWCATVNASVSVLGTPLPGAPFAGRECDTVFGDFVETFERYDDGEMAMTYRAESDKLPFFVRHFTNEYRVEPIDELSSRLVMKAGASMLQPFAFLMAPMMRMQLGGALKNLLGELKHFVERGTAHPRKVAAQKKHRAKQRAKQPA